MDQAHMKSKKEANPKARLTGISEKNQQAGRHQELARIVQADR